MLRWLPEINEIEGSLRRQTIDVFVEHCPAYFWEVPASSSGKYHPPDHRGRHGLVLHTKRAFVAYERLASSYIEQALVDHGEVNCGRAAILLHDLFKYGKVPAEQEMQIVTCLQSTGELPDGVHTESSHDVIAAQYFRENTDLPEPVLRCVETHNGPWGEGDAPATDLEQLHHMADMIASSEDSRFAVMDPCEELREAFPDLQTTGKEI